jgi:hypothetical protein
MKRLLLIAALTATVAGCMPRYTYTPPPMVQRPAFPSAEYEALPKTGSATVTGQAFLKTRGGDVKTGAGNTIYLEPVTSYSTFGYVHKDYRGRLSPVAPELEQYKRSVVADATGRFTFKDVPEGKYYLSGKVSWEVPQFSQYGSYMSTQGGDIWKTIIVKNGQQLEVMLTE